MANRPRCLVMLLCLDSGHTSANPSSHRDPRSCRGRIQGSYGIASTVVLRRVESLSAQGLRAFVVSGSGRVDGSSEILTLDAAESRRFQNIYCVGVPPLDLYVRRYGSDEVLELLAGLLALDPKSRLTAKEALAHRYFQTKPLPTEPGRCDYHEWGVLVKPCLRWDGDASLSFLSSAPSISCRQLPAAGLEGS